MDTFITLGVRLTPEATRILGEWDAKLQEKLGPPWQVWRWGRLGLLEGTTLRFRRPLHVVLSADAKAASSGWALGIGGDRDQLVYYRLEGVERRPLQDCGELGLLGRWDGS